MINSTSLSAEMLLIDAANVSGGGAVLLQYLIDQLTVRGVPFHVLKKASVTLTVPAGHYTSASVGIVNRGDLLRACIRQVAPSRILCFGNFPPPFATGLPTTTYVHNLHYLNGYDARPFGLRDRIGFGLRRAYLRYNLRHSDSFVVQTPYVQDAFCQTFGLARSRVAVLPFYDVERIQRIEKAARDAGEVKIPGTFLYASSAEPHKNHNTLLQAWELLHEQRISPTLYLTISPSSAPETRAILRQITRLQQRGVAIENKGSMAYDELLKLTYSCAYCIFPSVNETIGLGLLDGYWMSNHILASRKPYLPNVLNPSATFDPYDPASIADAVKKCLTGTLPKPVLVLTNQIDAVIQHLYPGIN